jgi:hypothetical protein
MMKIFFLAVLLCIAATATGYSMSSTPVSKLENGTTYLIQAATSPNYTPPRRKVIDLNGNDTAVSHGVC